MTPALSYGARTGDHHRVLRNDERSSTPGAVNGLSLEVVDRRAPRKHNASAYYCSPWEKAAGFSYDGSGDFVSTMMARCQGNDIEVLERVFLPHSLGSLYTMICEFIGYLKYGDEGKSISGCDGACRMAAPHAWSAVDRGGCRYRGRRFLRFLAAQALIGGP